MYLHVQRISVQKLARSHFLLTLKQLKFKLLIVNMSAEMNAHCTISELQNKTNHSCCVAGNFFRPLLLHKRGFHCGSFSFTSFSLFRLLQDQLFANDKCERLTAQGGGKYIRLLTTHTGNAQNVSRHTVR